MVCYIIYYNNYHIKIDTSIMTIKEYKELKKQLRKLEKLPITEKTKSNIETIRRQVEQAEQEDIISKYILYSQQLTLIQKRIGCWNYYKKDTTELVENQRSIEGQISNLLQQETGDQHGGKMDLDMCNPPVRIETQQSDQNDEMMSILKRIEKHLDDKQRKTKDASYYIINLAWSKDDGFIVNTIRDFLNTSNYIHSFAEKEECRNESIISWKFYYDTTEEIASTKSMLTAADHMLSILKSRYPGQTDAEVFGKIQRF